MSKNVILSKTILFISVLYILSGCGQSGEERKQEVLYRYTGNLFSLTDQQGEPVNKEYGVAYTLTERTKVYIQEGNTKTQIAHSSLSEYAKPGGDPDTARQKLEVWVTPYETNDWYIEAVEVIVLRDV